MEKDNKTKAIRRLKIVEGQVRALQRMLAEGTYCIDVLTQSAAVKQALSSVEDFILENHLSGCVAKQMKAGNIAKATGEIMTVYKLSKKK
jgi:DNA-binding FrmR family transcriptional regulator